MTVEYDTLLQLQKWWYAIHSAFCKSLSTNKIYTKYQNQDTEHYTITKFILPPENKSKYITPKENYEAFSISLRVHLVKDTTVYSPKAPKSHVKIVTHMQYDNGSELLITFVFNMTPQLGGLGPKAQDLVIPFCLFEGESLTYFHLRSLAIKSELISMRY